MRVRRLFPLLASLCLLSSCRIGDFPENEVPPTPRSDYEESSLPDSSSPEVSSTNEESSSSHPHEHSYSDDWTYDESSHWHASTCGHAEEVKDKAPHSFLDWTYGEIGEEGKQKKTRKCSVCPKTEEETIDYLGDEEAWKSLFPKFRNFTAEATYQGCAYKCLYTENAGYFSYSTDASSFSRVIEYLDDRAVEYNYFSSWGYWEKMTEYPYENMGSGIKNREDCVEYSFSQVDPLFSSFAAGRKEARFDPAGKAFIVGEIDFDPSLFFTVKDAKDFAISVKDGKLSKISYASNGGEAFTSIHSFGTTEDDLSFKEGYVEFSKGWSYDEECHWRASIHGDPSLYKSKAKHTFGDWAYGEVGDDGKQKRSRTCSICGKKEEETIDYFVTEAEWEEIMAGYLNNYTVSYDWGGGQATFILTENAYLQYYENLQNDNVNFYREFSDGTLSTYELNRKFGIWEKVSEKTSETDLNYEGGQSYYDYIFGKYQGQLAPIFGGQYQNVAFDKAKRAFCADSFTLFSSGSEITYKNFEIKFCQKELVSIAFDANGDGTQDAFYSGFGTSAIPSSFKEDLHIHSFDEGRWEMNEYQHWHPLSCEHEGEESKLASWDYPGYARKGHSMDPSTGKCSVCGYECAHSFDFYSPEVCSKCGYRHAHDVDASNVCSICGLEVNDQLLINGVVYDARKSFENRKSFTRLEEIYEKEGDGEFALASSIESKVTEEALKKSDSIYFVKEGEEWVAYSLSEGEDGTQSWTKNDECKAEYEKSELSFSFASSYQRVDENTLRATWSYNYDGVAISGESTLVFEDGILVSAERVNFETSTLEDGTESVKKTRTFYSDFDSTTIDLPDFSC